MADWPVRGCWACTLVLALALAPPALAGEPEEPLAVEPPTSPPLSDALPPAPDTLFVPTELLDQLVAVPTVSGRTALVRMAITQQEYDAMERMALQELVVLIDAVDAQQITDPVLVRQVFALGLSANPADRVAVLDLADQGDLIHLPKSAAPAPRPPPPPPPVPHRTPPPIRGTLPQAREEGTIDATLPNGMRVVIVGDPFLTQVAAVHLVTAGAAAEGPGESGYAHLVEHLMFSGTNAHPANELWGFVDEVGGYANAWTEHDTTRYLSVVLPESLPQLLDLESDRFLNFQARDEVVAKELPIIADEVRLRTALEPEDRTISQLMSRTLGSHPYGRSVGGPPEGISGASGASVQAFYERVYNTATLTLVIVGPQDPMAVYEEVERRYSGLRSGVAPPAPVAVDLTGRDPLWVWDPTRRRRQVGVAWALPPAKPCGESETSDTCTESYWADQLALVLLQTRGLPALEQEISGRSNLFVPLDTVVVRQDSGGFIAVLATRQSALRVAVWNTAWLSLTAASICGGVLIIPPLRSNPTASRVRNVMGGSSRDWLDDDAIEEARAIAQRELLSSAWSADERAMRIAESLALGFSTDESAWRAIGETSAPMIRSRYVAIFRREGMTIHVR